MTSTALASTSASRAILRAAGLRFSVGEVFAVGPVDLRLERGTTLGVVGETGSGKSLLCRTLVGMLQSAGGRIDEGSLEIMGENVAGADSTAWSRIRRRHIGFMPQASMSGLNPVRRIGSQLMEMLPGDRRDRRRAAHTLMQQVRMRAPERVLDSYPHQLSGGMRQRVMLSFALVGDPALLVADEPTTALDPTVQSEVLDLISDIQRERSMSLVLVSHDMRVIRRMCDDVLVMYRGSVVESGHVGQIMQRPQHPYTRALLQADPALAPRKSMLAVIDNPPETANGWMTRASVATATGEVSDE